MMAHPPTCTASGWPVDSIRYSDLIGGKEFTKIRYRCSAGHSWWEEICVGPAVTRAVKALRGYRLQARLRGQSGSCPHCGATFTPRRGGQIYCAPSCERLARNARRNLTRRA
jgi:hypothetical protein